MQWKELETAFLKFVEKLGLNISKVQKKSTRNELHDFLEEHATKAGNLYNFNNTKVLCI